MMSDSSAVQDRYPDDTAHCFGCGRLNAQGHQLKSYQDGEGLIARFTPQPYHTAVPGYVYGGLLASLVDCHATATASAAAARAMRLESGRERVPRFVTASLHVNYLRPTPLGPALEIRGKAVEVTVRKVVVEVTIAVKGETTVRGRVVAVPLPSDMQ